MFLQSSPLLSSVVRMEFGREVFHDGLEPLDASRLAQGEKVRCATPAFHRSELWLLLVKASIMTIMDWPVTMYFTEAISAGALPKFV